MYCYRPTPPDRKPRPITGLLLKLLAILLIATACGILAGQAVAMMKRDVAKLQMP